MDFEAQPKPQRDRHHNHPWARQSWIAQKGALYGYGVPASCLSGGNTPTYGTPYGQGDVIKLELDTDNENLIFCKNNVCHGVAYGPNCFDNNTTYYFSVAICNQRYAVSIN